MRVYTPLCASAHFIFSYNAISITIILQAPAAPPMERPL